MKVYWILLLSALVAVAITQSVDGDKITRQPSQHGGHSKPPSGSSSGNKDGREKQFVPILPELDKRYTINESGEGL